MSRLYRLIDLARILDNKSPDLLTRDLGRKAFGCLERELKQTPEHETLILDGKDIILFDSSFFDEAILNLFVKLIAGEYGNRFLLLCNVTEDSVVNVEGAIKRRDLKNALPIKNRAQLRFVGNLEPNLEETARLLVQRKQLTARELADYLKIGINNASNRLRRLHELRLAKREELSSESGLYHQYSALD
ncbi:hypothetical protein ANRL3_02369 [Anaerolineae bacterium]|nr:hypothetical protein ANRL3_02369 [Anaerolineae bacterium]